MLQLFVTRSAKIWLVRKMQKEYQLIFSLYSSSSFLFFQLLWNSACFHEDFLFFYRKKYSISFNNFLWRLKKNNNLFHSLVSEAVAAVLYVHNTNTLWTNALDKWNALLNKIGVIVVIKAVAMLTVLLLCWSCCCSVVVTAVVVLLVLLFLTSMLLLLLISLVLLLLMLAEVQCMNLECLTA